MFKLLFISIFYLFIVCIYSETIAPFRGTLKDSLKEISKNDIKESKNNLNEKKNEKINIENKNDDLLFISNINNNTFKNNKNNYYNISSKLSKIDSEESISNNENINENSKCGDSFTMWFSNGIAVTTISCGEYSAIYTGEKGKDNPAPKYITGEIKNVEIDSSGIIKVNGCKLSTISTDSGNPTENSDDESKNRLLDEIEIPMLKVYSFKISNKNIEVQLPNSDEAIKRNKYSLSSNGNVFYVGKANNSKYYLQENGDLVDSTGQIVLKDDSTSSAKKLKYFYPLIFIILTFIF